MLAARLREAMAAKNVDQTQLAEAAGCTQGAISQILLGNTRRSRFLPDIARALGVSLDWLRGAADGEAEAAARPPSFQLFSMRVALPSEAALMDMFRSLLVAVPADATRDETAAILARRLPAGLARIGPLALDPDAARWPASDGAAPDRGTDHSAAPPAPRS